MQYHAVNQRGFVSFCLTLVLISVSSTPARAVRFYASFTNDETIGSETFLEADILLIDDTSISVHQRTVNFFTQAEDIDALFVDASGDIYFSTSAGATIAGGVDGGAGGIDSGDVIRFNADTMDFSLFIEDAGPNVDALWVDNNIPYLSLSDDATVGSNTVDVLDDMVFTLTGGIGLMDSLVTVVLDSNDYLLDPVEEPDTATDVDAFAITDDGKYLFSSSSDNSFLMEGGNPKNPSDYINRDGAVVFILDPNDTASFDAREESSIYFDTSAMFEFDSGINIDALHFLPDDAPDVDPDFNGDTFVDAADYTVWRDSLGAIGLTAFDLGDANGDGSVTQADYELWKQAFGGSTEPGMGEIGALGAAVVPEPGTIYLAGIAGLVWSAGFCERVSRRV